MLNECGGAVAQHEEEKHELHKFHVPAGLSEP